MNRKDGVNVQGPVDEFIEARTVEAFDRGWSGSLAQLGREVKHEVDKAFLPPRYRKYAVKTITDHVRVVWRDVAAHINPKEGAWSISVALQYEISPEALPDVAAVWTMCVRHGIQFSVRQAVWVGRLSPLVKSSNPSLERDSRIPTGLEWERKWMRIQNLYRWAVRYATHERLAELRDGVDANPSTPLDGRLLFGGEEYASLVNADALPAYQSPWPPPLAGAPETTTNERHAIHNLDTLARDVGLNEGLDDLLSQLPKEKRTDGLTIWRVWMKAISRNGTQFLHMSETESESVLCRLRREIVGYLTDAYSVRPGFGGFAPSPGLLEEFRYREVPLASYASHPTETWFTD